MCMCMYFKYSLPVFLKTEMRNLFNVLQNYSIIVLWFTTNTAIVATTKVFDENKEL